MKIVVTGGSGFIGSHLVKRLEKEHELMNLDIADNGSENFIECDIRDRKKLEGLFKTRLADFDAVIHLAALSKEFASNNMQDEYFSTNVNGTFNVLMSCLNTNIKKFIFASSFLVYGDTDGNPIKETAVLSPNTIYSSSKVCGEALCSAFSSLYGLTTVCLRKSGVYGLGDKQKRIIILLTEKAKKNEEITIFGEKLLDFVHVDDVVEAYAKSLACRKSDVFNIGAGKGYDLENLAKSIIEITGSKSRIKKMPSRGGEVSKYVPDTAKARDLLNFTARKDLISFVKGLT